MEQGVVALCVTLSRTSFLLRHEDVGVRVVVGGYPGGGGSSSRGRSSGSSSIRGDRLAVRTGLGDGGGKRGNVFEDMSGVKELGVDVLWRKEVLADDENLCGDITARQGVRDSDKDRSMAQVCRV